jgi:hypothetical protein
MMEMQRGQVTESRVTEATGRPGIEFEEIFDLFRAKTLNLCKTLVLHL